MGNHQKSSLKQQSDLKLNHTAQNATKNVDFSSINQEFCYEEGINLQFVGRKDFGHSSNLIASKNLMEMDQSINFHHSKQYQLDHPIQWSIFLRLTDRVFRKIRSKPQYGLLKIDFRKFALIKQTPIANQYNLEKVIGFGSFGTVFKAQLKHEPGQFRAIKKIQKSKMKQMDTTKFFNQFQILKKCDHPNILKVYELFEDQQYFYVVSELCQAGNLFQYINNHNISQLQIKLIMIQVLYALKYLHGLRILHKDIKMENILIIEDNRKKQKKIQIKIIDFGLSMILSQSPPIADQMSGTLLYMSPQGLYGQLNLKSDIWSCGIILYILLTKHIPYRFRNEQDLIIKIQSCKITRRHLNGINTHAKNLINLMLHKDTKKRYCADRALKSEWLKIPIQSSVTSSQKRRAGTQILSYNMQNNLICIIQSYVAFRKVNQMQRQRLAVLFAQLDKDKSGSIDIRQFKAFYAQNSQFYDENEIQALLKVIDKNQSGFIDFTEFIVAMHNRRQMFHLRNLEEVFQFFDVDGSGNITKKQIKSALMGINNQQLQNLFEELDEDSNEEISKNQFFKYFKTNQSGQ